MREPGTAAGIINIDASGSNPIYGASTTNDICAAFLVRLRVRLKNIVAILNIPADGTTACSDVCRVDIG